MRNVSPNHATLSHGNQKANEDIVEGMRGLPFAFLSIISTRPHHPPCLPAHSLIIIVITASTQRTGRADRADSGGAVTMNVKWQSEAVGSQPTDHRRAERPIFGGKGGNLGVLPLLPLFQLRFYSNLKVLQISKIRKVNMANAIRFLMNAQHLSNGREKVFCHLFGHH